jgi:regulator of protease activity HflC (stomatin/prohibitin superfamily)
MKAYLWSVDEPPQTKPRRWRRFVEKYLPGLVIYLMVAALLTLVFYPRVVVTVPSGQVGVLWKRFHNGTVLDPRELLDEGLHLILPWDRVFLYDLRVQSITESYNAISKDGVSLTAALNIRYRLKHDSIPTLHQVIGPDYLKLLGPGVASQMREVVAQYTSEQVYSTARKEIQDKIRELTVERMGEKMMEREGEASYSVAMRDTVILYDTLLYGIILPQDVVNAINRKAEQYYISEEYKFRIERERRESERKKIEAEGIREFQQTVSQGISDSYLRWRGIEATLQLSHSTNSKVVIIGSGKDGLPVILGNVDSPAPPSALGTTVPDISNEKSLGPAPATQIGKDQVTTIPRGTPSVVSSPTPAPARSDTPKSFGPISLPRIESLLPDIFGPKPDSRLPAALEPR